MSLVKKLESLPYKDSKDFTPIRFQKGHVIRLVYKIRQEYPPRSSKIIQGEKTVR